jgi:cytochrome c oxidase subunit 3
MQGTGAAMGELVSYRPRRTKEETTAFLGMVIFLGSWAMMFAAVFFAYAYVRVRAGDVWPPEGLPRLPVDLPALNTAVLVVSSAAMQWGIWAVRRGKSSRSLGWAWLVSLLLGGLFLALQLWLWSSVRASGLTLENGGGYASAFYGLTWVHAAHVVVGLVGLGRVCLLAFKGEFSAARHLPARLWAMYWHFVGIIWALMFVSVFVM